MTVQIRRLYRKLVAFAISYLLLVYLVFTTDTTFGRIVVVLVVLGIFALSSWDEYRIMQLEDKLDTAKDE